MAEPDMMRRAEMKTSAEFEFDDLQALVRYGHGKLSETCFMLLDIVDADAAKKWLSTAPVTSSVAGDGPPSTALQVAFSVDGLRALGLGEALLDGFSSEFIVGLAGDESRSRRLGDVGRNAPEQWEWGGASGKVPHLLLLLYAVQGEIEPWRKSVEDDLFSLAFKVLKVLPTHDIGDIEPFGFVDGLSQPVINWERRQSSDLHEHDRYTNVIALGEFVLGYPNEYGLYTKRPLLDPAGDGVASVLPDAEENPGMKDFGRNGCYLVLRQLEQDVPGFWQFVDKACSSQPEERERLAASMVGRERNGSPLAPLVAEKISGVAWRDKENHFTYELDPAGGRCPIGSHIRRANPRTGDFPPGVTGFISRLLKIFGFGQRRRDEDLVASSRFHRLLRRGREYGPLLRPEDAVKPDAPQAERGLQFIALTANISRQFEFIQNAWLMNSKFSGVHQERDPLLGIREPLLSGESTDSFNHPDPEGPMHRACSLPQFITVRGGGYFFMPGLRALRYIAASTTAEGDDSP